MKDTKARFLKAKEIITRASEFLLQHQNERTEVTQKNINDFVTEADKENEAYITSLIHESFPEDAIFGEEGGKTGDQSTGRWILDPIDGTVNFMYGFPDFTISIAYQDEKGELIFGLVACPAQHELFSAYKGEGAFLNDVKIHVSDNKDLSRSLALCVYPHRKREYLDYYQDKMRKILNEVSDLRSIGSAALSLCYVACGRCSLYYEMFLALYDIAGGVVILREAGGEATLSADNYPIHVLASSSTTHQYLKDLLND